MFDGFELIQRQVNIFQCQCVGGTEIFSAGDLGNHGKYAFVECNSGRYALPAIDATQGFYIGTDPNGIDSKPSQAGGLRSDYRIFEACGIGAIGRQDQHLVRGFLFAQGLDSESDRVSYCSMSASQPGGDVQE